jgi:MFS family permease
LITQSQSPRQPSGNRTVLLGLTSAGLFLGALDAYVVVAALLPMLTSLHIPVNHLERATPIITGFILGYLAAMPLGGGLSDRFGRIRTFGLALLVFGVGSFVTATAGNLGLVVTGRLLQGAGGGALVPVVLALAADLYSGDRRSRVLGAVGGIQEVGSVLGPLWGGVLAASWGWRWIFWLNLPAAGLLLWSLWPRIRERPPLRGPADLDWLGAGLAAAGLALLTLALYAADPGHSPVGPGFLWQFPAAVLLLAGFVLWERRAPHPLIDLRHFTDLRFAGAATTNALAGAALMIALVYIPLLAEAPTVFNMTSGQAAWLLFRLMIGIPIGAVLGGWLAAGLRSWRIVAAGGLLLSALGFFLLSGWDQRALEPHVLFLRAADLQLFVTGLGLGLIIAPVSAALLDVVGVSERGAGASVLVLMRLLGMLVGFSLLAGFGLNSFYRATAHLQPPLFGIGADYAVRLLQYQIHVRQAILDEYHTIFRATAVVVLAAAVLAALTLRRPSATRL